MGRQRYSGTSPTFEDIYGRDPLSGVQIPIVFIGGPAHGKPCSSRHALRVEVPGKSGERHAYKWGTVQTVSGMRRGFVYKCAYRRGPPTDHWGDLV